MIARGEIKQFCKNLRYLRRREGQSLRQTAKMLRVDPLLLLLIEAGFPPASLSIDIIFQAEALFGVSPANLFLPLEQAQNGPPS